MNAQALQDVRQYLAIVHKRRGVVVTSLGVSLLVATLYNYTTRPVYQATAQLLIEQNIPNVLPTKELLETQAGADYYQTQYQLLRGRMLIERVIAQLQLQTNPEFRTGPLMSPWERIQRRFLGGAPVSFDVDGMLLPPAVAAFRSRLLVEPVSGSRLVNLRFSAYDPVLAANAVNALAQLYIQQSLEFRFTTSTEATGWLSDRVAVQKQKVEAAERALQTYRERVGLVNYEEGQGLSD